MRGSLHTYASKAHCCDWWFCLQMHSLFFIWLKRNKKAHLPSREKLYFELFRFQVCVKTIYNSQVHY